MLHVKSGNMKKILKNRNCFDSIISGSIYESSAFPTENSNVESLKVLELIDTAGRRRFDQNRLKLERMMKDICVFLTKIAAENIHSDFYCDVNDTDVSVPLDLISMRAFKFFENHILVVARKLFDLYSIVYDICWSSE